MRQYECMDVHCGGVFKYERISLGVEVPPPLCPLCGQETVKASEAAELPMSTEERERIGNTPTCDECGEQHSQDVTCEEWAENHQEGCACRECKP